MAGSVKLTPEQWRVIRRRWEGSDRTGFDWLTKEVLAAVPGLKLSRQGVSVRAAREGWEKGGPPSEPLAPVAQQTKRVAQQRAVVAQQPADLPESGPEVADEVVEAAPPPAPVKLGRPTAYRPEFAELILTYFDKEPFTEVDVPQPSGLVKRQRMATEVPMLAKFAKSIGVSKSTVDTWATALDDDGKPRHPLFAEAYARARDLQEALVVQGGVLGLYDPRVVQFILKNLCGWQDQPQRAVEVAPISREELEATYIKDIEEAHARQDAVDAERREFLSGLDA